jgi:hypothetical protein
MQNKPLKKRMSIVALILPGVLFFVVGSVPERVRPMTSESAIATPTPLPTRPRRASSPANPPPATSAGEPDLGPGASLHGKQVFPPDNRNQDISNAPVDPNSARSIAAIGADDRLHPDFGTVYRGAPNGIPYIVVSGTQPSPSISHPASESDPGPYPIPRDAPIEGGPNSKVTGT